MSLLLTRHVDQYRIDIRRDLGSLRAHGHDATLPEPLTDQLPVKRVRLDDEHPLHRPLPP